MTSPFNQEKMKREVYCPYCKTYQVSDQPWPVCECGHYLITVVYSTIDGRRLTGELATANSKST